MDKKIMDKSKMSLFAIVLIICPIILLGWYIGGIDQEIEETETIISGIQEMNYAGFASVFSPQPGLPIGFLADNYYFGEGIYSFPFYPSLPPSATQDKIKYGFQYDIIDNAIQLELEIEYYDTNPLIDDIITFDLVYGYSGIPGILQAVNGFTPPIREITDYSIISSGKVVVYYNMTALDYQLLSASGDSIIIVFNCIVDGTVINDDIWFNTITVTTTRNIVLTETIFTPILPYWTVITGLWYITIGLFMTEIISYDKIKRHLKR